jgi:hypothetical protein
MTQFSLAQEQKFYGTLVKPNPYMMTETLFGEKINLKRGEKVELINLIESKIKVLANNRLGYMWPDEFRQDSSFLEFNKLMNLKIQELKQTDLAQLEHKDSVKQSLLAKFDSVKSVYEDSSIYIVRAKSESITLYKHPNGEIISKLPRTEILKIKSTISNEYFEVVSLFDKEIKGYVIAHYCETDPKLNYKIELNNSAKENKVQFNSSPTIHTGPRGGKYYINKNGNKTYIKKN